MTSTLILALAWSQVSSSPTTTLLKDEWRRVITVAPRPLSDLERAAVRKGALAGKDAIVPELGRFVPFTTDGLQLAVWDGFLLEDRYSLAERVLRKLGDQWVPGQKTSLTDQPDLREWLSRNCPPDTTGKASNDAPEFQLSVGARVTLAVGDQQLKIVADGHEAITWPAVQAKTAPRKGDDEYSPTLPLTWSIETGERYRVEESLRGLEIVSKTFANWHREQRERMDKAAAKFFAKRDRALEAFCGDPLPIGRALATVPARFRNDIEVNTLASAQSIYRFASKDAAKDWLRQARIISIKPYLYCDLPKFANGEPWGTSFPVYLP